MKMLKRAAVAVAVVGVSTFAFTPQAIADEKADGTYVCVHYTYIYVGGTWVPTLAGVSISSNPDHCDFAVGA